MSNVSKVQELCSRRGHLKLPEASHRLLYLVLSFSSSVDCGISISETSTAGIVCIVFFSTTAFVKSRQSSANMRGIAALSPVKNRFKQMYPIQGSWGETRTVATSTPNKQGKEDYGEARLVTKEKTDPIVAFSRPPPPPPVFGPLLALSLLEALWSRSSDDD